MIKQLQKKTTLPEWCPLIPDEWEVKKLKYLAFITLGKMLNSQKEDGLISKPYLRAQNINWLKPNLESVKEMWFSEDEMSKFRLRTGDLLISEGGEVGRACIWNSELEECYIQNSVHRVRFMDNSLPKFFLYQFFAASRFGYFDSIVNRISIAHLTGEKLKETFWLFPSFAHQLDIANYLDDKTAQIDNIIIKKEKLIELLHEERAAIINQAVTKGLNPGAKMRPSGVEWLGEIPEHWEAVHFNHFILLKNGYAFPSGDFGVNGIKVIKITQLRSDGTLDLSEADCVDASKLEEAKGFTTGPGDILMALTGATLGKVARVPQVDEILLLNQRVGKFVSLNPKVKEDFLYWLLSSEVINAQILFAQRETGQPNIGKNDFAEMKFALPPQDEQQEIAGFLWKADSKFKTIISRIEKEIELLQEYRTALINEVVTGKVRVS